MAVRRILIIEDEDDVREVARLSLETGAGWEVFTARSGSEGLAKATSQRPDAILLDVMMPDLDGPATLRELHAGRATRRIPVIFLTAKVQAKDRQRYAQLGVTAVITKPFDPARLANQVSEALGWDS